MRDSAQDRCPFGKALMALPSAAPALDGPRETPAAAGPGPCGPRAPARGRPCLFGRCGLSAEQTPEADCADTGEWPEGRMEASSQSQPLTRFPVPRQRQSGLEGAGWATTCCPQPGPHHWAGGCQCARTLPLQPVLPELRAGGLLLADVPRGCFRADVCHPCPQDPAGVG